MDTLGTVLAILFFLGIGCSIVLWFLKGNYTLNSEWTN